MDRNIEKFEKGWFLSILRDGLQNKWFFLSPEDAKSVEVFNLDESEALPFYLKPKEARPLLKKAQVVFNSSALNDDGFPLVTVFVHKDLGME